MLRNSDLLACYMFFVPTKGRRESFPLSRLRWGHPPLRLRVDKTARPPHPVVASPFRGLIYQHQPSQCQRFSLIFFIHQTSSAYTSLVSKYKKCYLPSIGTLLFHHPLAWPFLAIDFAASLPLKVYPTAFLRPAFG